MSIAADAINSARTYLNDPNSSSWGDNSLFPPLREAFGELQLALATNRIPVIKTVLSPILVTAGDTIFSALPQNITSPIAMFERDPGGTEDDYEEMLQVDFLPSEDQDNYLTYWCWQAQMIKFLGATTNREVKLYYNGYLTVPNVLTDPLGFIFAERYLGPRTAAIALSAVGQDKRAASANLAADRNLYQVIQYNVTENQRPHRRKKYRSAKSSGDFGGSGHIVGVVNTDMPVWIAPIEVPDGIINVFTFSSPILYLTYNGTFLYTGVGYKSVGTKKYSITDSPGKIQLSHRDR